MKVCVFAGARGGAEMLPYNEWIGTMLARAGAHVYFGGSSKGIMGAVARGVKKAGGKITGVLPASIAALKHYDPDLDLIVTADMPTRKAHFWQCDAFLCLPGGFGTLDELTEIATETKLGHAKRRPIVVYNQSGFYDSLHGMIRTMVKYGTMDQARADLIQFTYNPEEAVNAVISVPGQNSDSEKS